MSGPYGEGNWVIWHGQRKQWVFADPFAILPVFTPWLSNARRFSEQEAKKIEKHQYVGQTGSDQAHPSYEARLLIDEETRIQKGP